MAKSRLTFVALLVLAASSMAVAAQRRVPIGTNPYPLVSMAPQSRPAAAPSARASRAPSRQAANGANQWRRSRWQQHDVTYVYEPWGGWDYWYPDGWSYRWPYGWVYPPAYVPATSLFGLQPGQAVAPPPNANFSERPAPLPSLNEAARRSTSAQSTARATKSIGYGDALFAKGEYAQANIRYRDAAHSAPQMADAYFRQGFALAATGRYDLAASAMRRGLGLDPKWPNSGFALSELCGANSDAKLAHLAALRKAAAAKPADANVAFMLGVYLHFDHQRDEAAKSFERTARLAGKHAGHVEPFLQMPDGPPPADGEA